MTWTEAFKRQATSDLDLFERLVSIDVPSCHHLHFLQMASEKAAKAREAQRTNLRPAFSHRGAGDLVRIVLSQDESLGQALGFATSAQRKQAALALRDTAVAVERLAPAIANAEQLGLNVEYPWESPNGDVLTPVGTTFSDPALDSMKLARLARFLRAFLERL